MVQTQNFIAQKAKRGVPRIFITYDADQIALWVERHTKKRLQIMIDVRKMEQDGDGHWFWPEIKKEKPE